MKWLRNVKNRILVSVIVGILSCILILGSDSPGNTEERMPLAWWGILYPKYCFMQMEEKVEEKKISFWFAKTLRKYGILENLEISFRFIG